MSLMWWRKNENWKVKSPFKVLPVNNTKKIKSKKKEEGEEKEQIKKKKQNYLQPEMNS